jgi:hypothetical protein
LDYKCEQIGQTVSRENHLPISNPAHTDNIAYRSTGAAAEALGRTSHVSKTFQSYTAMNIGDILIWEATNALLLIPIVIWDCYVNSLATSPTRFHRSDWLFLFGHPREKFLSLHLWLRFAVIWFGVVIIGFVEGYVLLPFGLAALLGAVFLTALVVWRVAPKLLR